MREVRIRSLYFGDLRARLTSRRRWVPALSLALSSAPLMVIPHSPRAVAAAALLGVVAITNAWALAPNLDKKVLALSALQTPWESVRIDRVDVWAKRREGGAP